MVSNRFRLEMGPVPRLSGLILTSMLLGAATQTRSAQRETVQRIDVVSQWGGLSPSPPPVTRMSIVNNGGVFRRNGEPIDSTLVTDFLSALDDPIVPDATLKNIGITQSWLDAHVVQVFTSFGSLIGGPRNTESRRELFRKTFTNPALIEPHVQRIFHCVPHTDDYPSVEVVVSLADGQTRRMTSTSQCGLMLPWSISTRTAPNYDVHLSHALAALMTTDATNYRRLSDDDFVLQLGQAVLHALYDELTLLDGGR